MQFLADDTLEGRNVGTACYEKAVDYVESQFKAIGLKPAGTSGFRQPVKFDSPKLAADQSQLVLVRDGKEDAGWDDLAGVDVRGKIAVYVNASAVEGGRAG